MRVLGIILVILGMLSLLGGGALLTYTILEVQPFINEASDSKEAIEQEVDNIDSILSDASIIRTRAQELIKAYNQGNLRNPDDPRISKFFKDVDDLSNRSEEIRKEVKDEIDTIKDIADTLENRAMGLVRTGGAGGILLVLSGWIVVLGMLCLRKN